MSINFQVIETEQNWERIISYFPEANFLQSFYWGEFEKKLNKKVFRFALLEKNQPIIALQIVKETAKRGNYLTIAGGPLLDWEKQLTNQSFIQLINFLKTLAQKENCSFIRFRPQTLDSEKLRQQLKKYQLVFSPMHLTADLTLQLDLTKSPDQLLQEMRKNTRYEIRQAEKKGITVTQSQDPRKIKEFYQYQLELANKHNFIPFSYEFLLTQFETFGEKNKVTLFSSYLENKLLASAFIIFYNQEAVYHYGISTEANYKLPGAYACQWAAIQEAQKRGCKKYNFWGIAPKDEPHHRFAGVSLFKRGFGGKEVAYLPAHDLPVSPFYWLTYLFESFRKKIRKL